MSKQKQSSLAVQLVAISLARLFLNIGLRMVYPFAPALARGLGVQVTAVYRLITLRNFAGFLSPIFSPLSEKFGRRKIMIGSMLLLGIGCGVVAIWPAYWPLGVTLALISLAKVIYDPAMQAYVGDVVPYKQRGRAIAVTELSWAGALLLGAPAVGLIIAKQGWRAPFIWLGVLGTVTAVFLWRTLPPSGSKNKQGATIRSMASVIRHKPVIWAASIYILLAMGANEILFIVYGDWMESSFQLSLASLGVASGVIGGSEVIGEVFAGWSVDRFGKRPVIITAGVLNALMYAIIPFTIDGLTSALITLFVLFLFFEITVVGGVPLMTELVPEARSVVMGMVLAFGALGRALGSLIGPLLWSAGGFVVNGMVAGLIMLVAIGILARWIREAK
ncbi:MAG: MFS transporter [Chloroflexi bacterium]|nr:MFS transporter [Chloroflexota bacterium]